MSGRLLDLTLGDPYSNVALEEALLRGPGGTTLRVWENQESVVIGRAQLARLETDLEYCAANYVPVVRRVSAGGAVYNGRGNINWSYFVGAEEAPERGAKAVFERFAALVVEALKACGVRASYQAPNTIVDWAGKVCGMAAYISKEKTLCHGTLLVEADLDLAVRLTTPMAEVAPRRYPRSRAARMSNCGVGKTEFVEALAVAGGFEFSRGTLRDDEEALLRSLLGKYRSERWNLGDPFDLDDL